MNHLTAIEALRRKGIGCSGPRDKNDGKVEMCVRACKVSMRPGQGGRTINNDDRLKMLSHAYRAE